MTVGLGTLALSHETPDDRSGSSRWQRMTLTLTQHPLAVHGQCMDPTGTLVCRVHETHVLGDDAVEVLGPRRPAFEIPRVLVTVLVAQHGGHIVDDSTKAAWEASRNECSL